MIERIGSVPGVSRAASRTLAALFEHYGRRAGELPERAELRHALIRYLDSCEPERREYLPPPGAPVGTDPALAAVTVTDELPRHIDDAEVLLNTLEAMRGGVWPVLSEAIERRNDSPCIRGLSVQVERALGWSQKRGAGITDETMLLVLGVALLQSYEPLSDTAAITLLSRIREALGDTETEKLASLRSQHTRAKAMILATLGELAPAPSTWVAGVRRAYDERAASLDDALVVNLRAA